MQKYWYLQGVADKEQGNPMQFVPDKDEQVYNPVLLSAKDMEYIRQKDYENGQNAMLESLKEDAIRCKVDWCDGPLLDYTQEQQDDVLEKIGADVDDNVLVIILKDTDYLCPSCRESELNSEGCCPYCGYGRK